MLNIWNHKMFNVFSDTETPQRKGIKHDDGQHRVDQGQGQQHHHLAAPLRRPGQSSHYSPAGKTSEEFKVQKMLCRQAKGTK